MQPKVSLNVSGPGASAPAPRFRPFALGFRPFFLLAGLAAVLLLAYWLGVLALGLEAPAYYGGVGWHAHEMVFGFAAAAISGFLLTAVRNWTGRDTVSGWPLAALVVVWLAARLMPLCPWSPAWLLAGTDLAFLPLVALCIAPALFSGKANNLVFLLLLAVFTGANAMVHADALGFATDTAAVGSQLGVNLVVFFVVVIGGRVIPFFTEKAVAGFQAPVHPRLEAAVIISLIALIAAEALYPQPLMIAVLAALVVFMQAARLAGWQHRGLWSLPILWVLHLAYGWLILGFALKVVAAMGGGSEFVAIHALTVGGVGTMVVGMMSRVALGHTGREIVVLPGMGIAFVLINLAALSRVFGPLVFPAAYSHWLLISGGLWMAAFGLFVYIYTPILLRARVDGRPG